MIHLPINSQQRTGSIFRGHSRTHNSAKEATANRRKRRKPTQQQTAMITSRIRRSQPALFLLVAAIGCSLMTANGSDSAQAGGNSLTGKASGQFCQPQTVGQRMQNQQQAMDLTKKVFCFYDIQDDFRPQDLNPCLCTHVVYSYVAVRKNLSFIAGKKGDLRSLASLKRKNSNLKLLVSLRPDDYFSFEVTSPSAAATLVAADSLSGEQQRLSLIMRNETTTAAGSTASASAPAAASETTAASTTTANSSPTGTQLRDQIQMNEMHQKFAKRIRDFIVRHSLDGINLDWPYFAQTMPSVNASREHLNLALLALNENFQTSLAQSIPSSTYLRNQSPIVTLTASRDFYSIVDGYDFHQINKLLDFVHLPAFDFDLNVDQWSIGHPARLHGISDAENLDTLVDLLLSSGLPSEQLVAGVPTHGVQITSRLAAVGEQLSGVAPGEVVGSTRSTSEAQRLSSSSSATNLDEQLEAAANISIVSHSEVCRIRDLARKNCTTSTTGGQQQQLPSLSCWTVSRARDLTAPFAYDSEHWIGFDDETSIKLKAKYVLLRHLAGIAVFTVNSDDPAGQCGFGSYPLLATINGVFSRAPVTAQPTNSLANGATMQASKITSYYTRAPNQMLTATSLMNQIFGRKLAAQSMASNGGQQWHSTTPSLMQGDLTSSASDEIRDEQQRSGQSLMSFVDIIEKYGAVNRLDTKAAALGSESSDPALLDSQLPCEKIGYHRYPRDCSRFYRCVQTPPFTTPIVPIGIETTMKPNEAEANGRPQKPVVATTTTTRLQYECPSGLVFDEQYQICNWPSWSAQCTGSGEVNSITNSKFVCPNYGYFQNQENCEYFYYCSDYNRGQSQAYQFRCPFELGFDEEKLQCNWKWLVKGCNLTSSDATGSNNIGGSSELAKKYLENLDLSGNFTSGRTTSKGKRIRKKRSLTNQDAESPEMRTTPAWASHVTSLLASVAAIRERNMKKSAQPEDSTSGLLATGINKTADKRAPLDNAARDNKTKYPSFIGAPHTTAKPPTRSTSFRTSWKKSTQTPSVELAIDASVSSSSPYKRRPPPPSIFPFLPASAIYMVVDSFRSYGEAIQGELNRFMRLAGNQMRSWFGSRKPLRRDDSASNIRKLTQALGIGSYWQLNPSSPSASQKRIKRDSISNIADLQALESAQSMAYHAVVPLMPRRPAPRYESMQSQLSPQQQYRDSLGRPPGYPLNLLDEVAKSAVLRPEPKLYSQPSALISSQMSGITQQDYERLIKSGASTYNNMYTGNEQRQPLHYQMSVVPPSQQRQPSNSYAAADQMMAASSVISDHTLPTLGSPEMVTRENVSGQPRETIVASNNQRPQVARAAPFGMPAIVAHTQRQEPMETSGSESSTKRPRRSTIAMKLVTFARPKFVKPPQHQQQLKSVATTKGYMSFLPKLSNVVGPARNFMNKAMHDLISTLSPGTKNSHFNSNQANNPKINADHNQAQQALVTTPMPLMQVTIRNNPLYQQQQSMSLMPSEKLAVHKAPQTSPYHHQQQQHQKVTDNLQQQFEQNPTNLTKNGPLLLTEQEARALSSQLDQLSKEQLEMLSNELFASEQKQLPQAYSGSSSNNNDNKSGESQDYVIKLLKMLSKTSHNPEDVKLLDQLAGQLNNPQPHQQDGGGGDSSLIELGQPDDLALLEALGFVSAGTSSADDNKSKIKYSIEEVHTISSTTITPNVAPHGPITETAPPGSLEQSQQDNQQEASYSINQHRPQPQSDSSNTGSSFFIQTGIPQIVQYPNLNYAELKSNSAEFLPMTASEETTSTYRQVLPSTTESSSMAPIAETTTSTSQSPNQMFTELMGEPTMPVRHTFTELIEPNATAPDGVGTSNGAISAVAKLNIETQTGLSLAPRSSNVSPSSTTFYNQKAFNRLYSYNIPSNLPVNQFEEVTKKENFRSAQKQPIVAKQQQSNQDYGALGETGKVISQVPSFKHQQLYGRGDENRGEILASDLELSALASAKNIHLSNLQQEKRFQLTRQLERRQYQPPGTSQIDRQYGLTSNDQMSGSSSDLTRSQTMLSGGQVIVGHQMNSAPVVAEQGSDLAQLPVGVKQTKKSKSKRKKRPSANSKAVSTTVSPIVETTSQIQLNATMRSNEQSPGNRVENAFNNFMVELRRSRTSELTPATTALSSNTGTEITLAQTTTTMPSSIATATAGPGASKKKRKSRSKKGGSQWALSADKSEKFAGSSTSGAKQPLRGWESSQPIADHGFSEVARKTIDSRRKLDKGQAVASREDKFVLSDLVTSASSASNGVRVVESASVRSGDGPSSFAQLERSVVASRKQVAIYGTKSGFIPIITPDDPSYLEARPQFDDRPRQQQLSADPLSFSASLTSSKHETLDEMNVGSTKPSSDLLSSSSATIKANNNQRHVSWKNFVSKLNDQISVVNLGNYTERVTSISLLPGNRIVQVKLVILPSSPNNQLLDNWNHLTAYYPQLFPALGEVHINTIDLGQASIDGTNGGSIEERVEEMRVDEFKRQFGQISRLIEKRTFKALDEIVQRSEGRLFMMQRKDDGSRTIIAVIPDKPLSRPLQRPAGNLPQISKTQTHPTAAATASSTATKTTTTTTTAAPTTVQSTSLSPTTTSSPTSSVGPNKMPTSINDQTPHRAATFSRAIQESIQEAIRQHYDFMKNQLKQSLSSTTADDDERLWSTPPVELLATIETSTPRYPDSMDTSDSSTEYSIVRLTSASDSQQHADSSIVTIASSIETPVTQNYASHSVYEVDGAEPKALYGLDLSSHQDDQSLYFRSLKQTSAKKVAQNNDTLSVSIVTTSATPSAKPYTTTASSRFISIGSHLIASPMKLPKVVDQAYVNHFYDHISDHQLAKAAGFDEMVSGSGAISNAGLQNMSINDDALKQQQQQQQNTATSSPSTSLSEDSLVPESACTRAGLFQHPFACNKFYECFWDKQSNKYTLHMFECPIKLAFDDRVVGCAMPIGSSLCINY